MYVSDVKSAGEIGIITPKDVLRNYVSTRSVALVQIVGLDKDLDSLDGKKYIKSYFNGNNAQAVPDLLKRIKDEFNSAH